MHSGTTIRGSVAPFMLSHTDTNTHLHTQCLSQPFEGCFEQKQWRFMNALVSSTILCSRNRQAHTYTKIKEAEVKFFFKRDYMIVNK